MISNAQYGEHILKLNQIYNSQAEIRSDSRIEKSHGEAKRLKKINFKFVKHQRKKKIKERNKKIAENFCQMLETRKKKKYYGKNMSMGNLGKSLRSEDMVKEWRKIKKENLKYSRRIRNVEANLKAKVMIQEIDHRMKTFNMNKKWRSDERSIKLLPIIKFPQTIFFKKTKKVKRRMRAMSQTKMDDFFRAKASDDQHRKYYKKGKLHVITSEKIVKSVYGKGGKLIRRSSELKSVGPRSRIMSKKKSMTRSLREPLKKEPKEQFEKKEEVKEPEPEHGLKIEIKGLVNASLVIRWILETENEEEELGSLKVQLKKRETIDHILKYDELKSAKNLRIFLEAKIEGESSFRQHVVYLSDVDDLDEPIHKIGVIQGVLSSEISRI